MKLALAGVGGAGGAIVDAFVEYDRRSGVDLVEEALAFDTDKGALLDLDGVPTENRVRIGQPTLTAREDETRDGLGVALPPEDEDEIQGSLDGIPAEAVDAVLVVAGLGGATGSGAGPVLAGYLDRRFAAPVYGLGVLPASREEGLTTVNAARALDAFPDVTDNLLIVDNDVGSRGADPTRSGYETVNAEIARRVGVLFAAGTVDPGADVPETVVDAREIVETLSSGDVSTIGYAAREVHEEPGLLSRLGGDDGAVETADATDRIAALTREAGLDGMALPCDLAVADSALLVVAGPDEHLTRKGIERGRQWVEERTESFEVRAGDHHVPASSHVACALLLSGVTAADRLDEIRRPAVGGPDVDDGSRDRRDAARDGTSGRGSEELEPLF